MKPRRRSAAVLAALMLALSPAAAFGQSAGDDQYEDPFAGQDQEQAEPTPTPSPVTSDPGFEDEEPAPAQPAAEEQAEEPQEAAPAPAAANELPRTGSDTAVVALLGSGLLLTGVGLRLRLRDGAARG